MLNSFAAEIDSSYSSSRLKIVIVIVKKNYVMWKYFFWSFDRVCVVAKALSPNFSIVFWWKIQRGLTQKPANCMKIRGIVRVHQTHETYRVDETQSIYFEMDEAPSRILFYLLVYKLRVHRRSKLVVIYSNTSLCTPASGTVIIFFGVIRTEWLMSFRI